MRLTTLALLVSCLAATAPAQQNILYWSNGTPTGTANAFPFGASTGVRQQQLVPGSVLGMAPVLIQDLFVAHLKPQNPINTMTDGEIVYGDFEIRMGVTTVATLVPQWSTNLPNPTTVHKGRLRMRWKQGTFTPIGLQAPFLWLPTSASDNLCIDFILWNVLDTGGIVADVNGYIMGTATDSAIARCWLRGWPSNQSANATTGSGGVKLGLLLSNGNFVGRGKGCASSATTVPALSAAAGSWPRLGATFSLQLDQAAAAVPAFPILGSSELAWGATSLPFDLGTLNAPGCQLWIDPLVVLAPLVTSGTGSATAPVPVPNLGGLLGMRLYASSAMLDPVNGLGIVTSDYGLMILGT